MDRPVEVPFTTGTSESGGSQGFRGGTSASFPIPAPEDASMPRRLHVEHGTIRWILRGDVVNISGLLIDKGMIYVGSRARAAEQQMIEPALVDPRRRKVFRSDRDVEVADVFRPSFDTLTPPTRGAYLEWLASDRDPVSAPDSFLRLYFFGIERRFFVDLEARPDHYEAQALAAEVRRLHDSVSASGDRGHGLFVMHALDFLRFFEGVDTHRDESPVPDPSSPTLLRYYEIPPSVRIAIGRQVAEGMGVSADWAVAYVRSHPEINLRTPATRCVEEFDRLFELRYRERFEDGFRPHKPKRHVKIDYTPASPGLKERYVFEATDVPDAAMSKPLFNALRDLAIDCTDELDSYSRFLGRDERRAGTLPALGLLPDVLLREREDPSLRDLRDRMTEAMADGAAVVSLDDLVGWWDADRTKKLTKREASSLVSLLAKLGVGMEPDVRFGARTPSPGTSVVLFPLGADAPDTPTPQYRAMSTLVHLTAVLAAADGHVDPAEKQLLTDHLEQSLGLSAGERERLEAHFLWLTTEQPGLRGLKARVDELSVSQREAIGALLVDLAAADGSVSPEEITELTKLYRLLGLSEDAVFSGVHQAGIVTEPRPAAQPSPGTKSPRTGSTVDSTGPVRIDPDKLEARLAETETVTALLADIFQDEDDDPEQPPVETPSLETELIDGLDHEHSALATALRGEPEWDREAAEVLAQQHGLPLLDGALDRINEAAMDVCGEPLIEGDDPLELNEYAAEEMFS